MKTLLAVHVGFAASITGLVLIATGCSSVSISTDRGSSGGRGADFAGNAGLSSFGASGGAANTSGGAVDTGGGGTFASNQSAAGSPAQAGTSASIAGNAGTTSSGAGTGATDGSFAGTNAGDVTRAGSPATTGGASAGVANGGATSVGVGGGVPVNGAGTAGVTPVSGGAAGVGTTNGGSSAIAGAPTLPPSCVALTSSCQGESCCRSIAVPGGSFPMGRSTVVGASDYFAGTPSASEGTPEHPAVVAGFTLDKYEVTVGRFRRFVDAYDAWRASGNPQVGSGAHPIAPYTGWGRSWTPLSNDLPETADALRSGIRCNAVPSYLPTWTDVAGGNETYPINCVNWYIAFAFCIWDGGRLPTEAEWEYAAAGGAENRLFPWGSATPDSTRANYFGSSASPLVGVGSRVNGGGAGAFGHADLAGSVFEWVFDWYSASYYGSEAAPSSCNNCANTSPMNARDRVIRGGGYFSEALDMRAASRSSCPPNVDGADFRGFRCARD